MSRRGLQPRPMLAAMLLALPLLGTPPTASAQDIHGTAYTVTYRGPSAPAQPRAAGGMLQLVLAANGQALASAGYDPQLRGWLFQLPMAVRGPAPLCLAVRNAARQWLPLRSGDDPFRFRNPLWEAELQRSAELAELRHETSALDRQLADAQARLQRVQADIDADPLAQGGSCALGPPPPEPERPPAALDAEPARAAAGGLCAARWDEAFTRARVDAGRLFAEAGLGDDWAARAAAAPVAAALPALRLQASTPELQLIVDAASKGRLFLEHAEGLRALTRVHARCRSDAEAAAAAALRDWERARQTALDAPQRARAACLQRSAQADHLRALLQRAPGYRSELERRIDTLQRVPSANAADRLDRQRC